MAYTNSNQIGEITEVTGVAKIIRSDGTEETVTLGTEVFQGDIVETSDAGAVNIGFIDDSSFAVSNDARIAIDEFVFDPETEGGIQDFSVMKGVFMYTSGLIGRENPDQVEIDTPVGSIGIRGTIIGGDINPAGESSVSVLEGAIVVRNDGGEQLLTNQYETVTLTSRDVAPSEAQQLDATRIANKFETVKDVSPSLFSSLNDQMAQEQNNTVEEAPAEIEAVKDTAEQKEEAKAEEEAVETVIEEVVTEEEQALEETQPEAETLEDSIEQIETLDTMPEMKTIEMNIDATKSSETRPRAKLLQQLRESLNEEQSIDQVQFISKLEFDLNLNGNLKEANNGQAFSTAGSAVSVGFVTLSEGANVTYELFADASGRFSIDQITGELFFEGTHLKDFENGDAFNIGVKATDNETGRILAKAVQIGVSDVVEIKIAQEDVFDFNNLQNVLDDAAVVDINNDTGVRIAKLDINGPGTESLTTYDFAINGMLGGQAASQYFAVVQDHSSGDFYVELNAGFEIKDHQTSMNLDIFDGVNFQTYDLGANFDFGINVLGETFQVKLEADDVTTKTTGDLVGYTIAISTAEDVVIIEDHSKKTITLADDDFKFIQGGDGYDMIRLDSIAGNLHNFSPTAGLKNNLSQIEQIRFSSSDHNDVLKIDIDNIINLLQTSNQNLRGQGELAFAKDGDLAGTHNGIYFKDGGNGTTLINEGFTKSAELDIRDSGEQVYESYHHADYGTVLIETSINGADTGGLL